MSKKGKEANRGKDEIIAQLCMACLTPPLKYIWMLFSVLDANEKRHGYKINKSQSCQ